MALIVEFFGPPASGKTTFAKALAKWLRAEGLEVGLHLSARPGEAEPGGSASTGLRRLVRPVWELVSTRAAGSAVRGASTSRLMPFLAHVGRIKQLRMRQYLYRLSAVWARAEASPGVFIFDQAYLQFVASLLAICDVADRDAVGEALRAVPRADVALRVDAAPDELSRRLASRMDNVGAIGRLLEAGAGRSESYLELSELMQERVEEMGGTVITARSGSGFFAEETERVAKEIQRARATAEPIARAS